RAGARGGLRAPRRGGPGARPPRAPELGARSATAHPPARGSRRGRAARRQPAPGAMGDRAGGEAEEPVTRIRVAHLISALGVGGAENMLLNLGRRLDGDRFESRVITLLDADGPLAAELAAAGTPVVGLGVRRDPLALPRLVRLLRSWRPAILQSWLYHAD